MTSPTHSRHEKLAFSGRDEDFPAFSEQFAARMHVLRVGDCLQDKLKVPAVKRQETASETTAGDQHEKKRQSFFVWCVLSGQGFDHLYPSQQSQYGS